MTYERDPIPGNDSEFELGESEHQELERFFNRLELLGIEATFGIYSGKACIAGKDITKPMRGASTVKLHEAEMAIHMFSSDVGTERKEDADGERISQLITTSLEGSSASNEAYSALGVELGGPAGMNAYYTERGWKNSLVGESLENGRAIILDTTANEAYDALYSILHDETGDPVLRHAAQKALDESAVTRYGIRQFVAPTAELRIYNKTGEIGPYRNDVGQVGELGYAIFTKGGPDTLAKASGKWANMAVAEFTAKVAELAGASTVPRSMATRAIFGSAWS